MQLHGKVARRKKGKRPAVPSNKDGTKEQKGGERIRELCLPGARNMCFLLLKMKDSRKRRTINAQELRTRAADKSCGLGTNNNCPPTP